MARRTRSYSSLPLETTTVPAAQSMAEIQAALVANGARSVETIYDGGKPVGLSWSMVVFNRPQYFALPARVDPVYRLLQKQRPKTKADVIKQQAERVAWRQMRAWVDAQIVLVQLGMVEFGQAFLPYAQGAKGGPTMWEAFRDHQRLLGSGSGGQT